MGLIVKKFFARLSRIGVGQYILKTVNFDLSKNINATPIKSFNADLTVSKTITIS